jgi:hypothetical protein
MRLLLILVIIISTGCGDGSITIASLDDKYGEINNSFTTVIGEEYLAFFYLEIQETGEAPFYCELTHEEIKQPCGVVLDQFEIDTSLKSKNEFFKGDLDRMVTGKKLWSAGAVVSYQDAEPQEKFIYKQPFLRKQNKGVGWLMGKIKVSNFDTLESVVKFKINGKDWLRFKPRIVLVTLDDIYNI